MVRAAGTTSCGLTHRGTRISSKPPKHVTPSVVIMVKTGMAYFTTVSASFALLGSSGRVLSTAERSLACVCGGSVDVCEREWVTGAKEPHSSVGLRD